MSYCHSLARSVDSWAGTKRNGFHAIKHGMAGMSEGTVTIRGREVDGIVIVQVLDTGKGPPASIEEESSEGLGVSLIRNLIGDIGGRFELRRTDETPPRTCAEVRFPLSQRL